jgi:fumarate hydratase, class II
MNDLRKETDSLGEVNVPANKLWGAQTQRSLEHFSIGRDLMPREMIQSYAILKKAAANANYAGGRLDGKIHKLIVHVCDEILAGQHHDMFPLHVWMTGSGTQFNMNVNEVISNRCCQIAGTALGSKLPVHPNDHVNMSQSSNDSFPSAMYIAAALNVTERLVPSVEALHDAIAAKSSQWDDIVKIGRTHMQDATPLTLGQEWSGYAVMLADNLARIDDTLKGVYRLALGGTAVGTGINAAPGLCRGRRRRDRALDGPALRQCAEQVRSAGRARRAGAAFRHAAHARRLALQDRKRHPPVVLRSARGLCRTDDTRERARLVDHAGQGQSDAG